MDPAIIDGNGSIEKTRQGGEAAAPRTRQPARGGDGSFEHLLGRVTRELQDLRSETRQGLAQAAPESIGQPEDLQEALKEAGRKYDTCMELGKHLLKAYEATVKQR